MNGKVASGQICRRLYDIRNRFDDASANDKLALLQLVGKTRFQTPGELVRLHLSLCFIRAFPDSLAHFRLAREQLQSFERRVDNLPVVAREALWDTGIIGTPVHYAYSFEVASWMARRAPGTVSIDWEGMQDTSRLDELLEHFLQPAETDYFDSGEVDSNEWISLASTDFEGTDFDWLLAQMRQEHLGWVWSQLFNASDLELVWNLRDVNLSKSRNFVPVRKIHCRRNGMRKQLPPAKKEIMRPLDSLKRVSPRAGSSLIDAAMASLAVRHRETYHFNHANPREVYLADVGEGVSVAVFGLLQKFRFPLECTMGYLILSNGAPIGYGGSSVLFRQVNTGLNIFDEYRGSEAAFLWIQVMRVYHQLAGCTRFIANPYQFGADNDEALQSGAFWLYHRLGYRPVEAAIRKLAERDSARMKRDRKFRSDLPTLRRLASCDMHLTLPGARASDLFDERWIETSSMLVTNALATAGGATRAESADRVARKVASDLQLQSVEDWSASEQLGFHRLAPVVAATRPAAWTAAEKKSMRELLKANGGPYEVNYARLLSQHGRFLSELRARCRRAE